MTTTTVPDQPNAARTPPGVPVSPPDLRQGHWIDRTPAREVGAAVAAPPERDGLFWRVACDSGLVLVLAPATRVEVTR